MRCLLVLLVLLASSLSAAGQTTANPPAAEAAPEVVLLLPGESTPFGRAAAAVRAGFFAAHAAAGSPMAVDSRSSDETAAAVSAAVEAAAKRGARLVVGPLSRDAVDALARAGGGAVPVLALNSPSSPAPLPESMLALGLRIEDEARSIVRALFRGPLAVGASNASAPVAVVVGSSALERRAAAAFAAGAREFDQRVETLEFSLKQDRVNALAKRLAAQPWRAVLLALDAGEAATLRPWLPAETTVVATSRVYLADGAAVGLAADLEGLAFADMPWLVEPDHAAVMSYPRAGKAYSAELQRLYALGIDAYRVGTQWMTGATRFEIDGVTGWLRVDPALGGRVERLPVLAVIANGKPERRDVLR
jgi:outer membrane PBP1 activator LpoA protein